VSDYDAIVIRRRFAGRALRRGALPEGGLRVALVERELVGGEWAKRSTPRARLGRLGTTA
jgi:hypothetical protein